ncbi:hypothetical protein JJJ17_08585 [Paracoccus caeni]|uniref:Uncharacterized protein n=1 Tax=Paracoccus caeni TaxID=657651 RepID=A0A934SE34_9RHOB|nr:hypothetical protein [Paracoccus caeni]MBK4215978.1 hypothetical protein [Paracoccus caeni]
MTYPDGLSLPRPDERDEDRRSTASIRPAMLDLMLPAELPADLVTNPAEAALIARTLDGFLDALDLPERRGARCQALLASLGHAGSGGVAGVGQTDIPAKTAEVEDFDRYFNVRRVATDSPALTLLRGLLQTATAVLSLAERGSLPPAKVARQVQGFASYARLLERLCNLDPRTGAVQQ